MNITYRALSDKELKRARQFRLRSFIAFMGIGAVLVVLTFLLGAPYGMRPAGWPWTPADWYGVDLGMLLAGMLLAGGFLVFSQKMLHVDALVRRKSERILPFAVPMTILSLTLSLTGALFLLRMGLVSWMAYSDGWRPGVVWSTRPSDDPIIHVAFAADGQSMVAWYKSGTVRTWLLGRGKEQSAANAPPTGPLSLSSAALAYEKTLKAAGVELKLSGTNDLELLQKDGKKRLLTPHLLAGVTSLALGGDGDPALVGCKDGSVQIFDTASGKDPRQLSSKSPVSAVALKPDGQTAASGHDDGMIRLWNIKVGTKGNNLYDFKEHKTPVTVLAFDGSGRRLASMAAQSNVLFLWDVESYKFTSVEVQIQDPTHLALSSDGRYAIIVANSSIHVLRLPGPG